MDNSTGNGRRIGREGIEMTYQIIIYGNTKEGDFIAHQSECANEKELSDISKLAFKKPFVTGIEIKAK